MTGIRRALVVACGAYDNSALDQLRSPTSDVTKLSSVLAAPQIGNYVLEPPIVDQPSHVVSLAIERFLTAPDGRPDDMLLLYITGHGVKDETGELYFAARNTDLDFLGSTAIPASFVNRCVNRSRSRQVVLLLDCCYSGAFARSMTPRASGDVDVVEQFRGKGRAVVTASSAMEYAFEGGQLTRGSQPAASIFTSALAEGLESGAADVNGDGVITLDELYEFVRERVREVTPNQTPHLWLLGVDDRLEIARSARRGPETWPPRPVIYQTPRSALLLPLLLAFAAIIGFLLDRNIYTIIYGVAAGWTGVKQLRNLLRGRTEFTSTGMTVRTTLRAKSVPWAAVTAIDEVRLPLSRAIRVSTAKMPRHKGKGGGLSDMFGGGLLPAPRSHLLAPDRDFDTKIESIRRWRERNTGETTAPMTVVPRWISLLTAAVAAIALTVFAIWVDQPWQRASWPWSHDATRLPLPCAVVDGATVIRMIGHPVEGFAIDNQSCQWGSLGTNFKLTLQLYDKSFDSSADSEAASEMQIIRSSALCGGSLRPQVGIGDEADVCTDTELAGSSNQHESADFEARKHNVVIEVWYDYWGIRSEDDMASLARQVAAKALAKVSF